MPGLIPGQGRDFLRKFLHTTAYVDPSLTGYLDDKSLASRILGKRRHCGVMDNILYIQGPSQALVIIHCPHVSTASLSKGWGFRGAYRPTCSAVSTLSLWVLYGRRGAWAPCKSVYLVCRELCHLVQYTCPLFCCSLLDFKPLNKVRLSLLDLYQFPL